MLNTLAEQVSVALHNAEFYRAAIITSERANAAWQETEKMTYDLHPSVMWSHPYVFFRLRN